LGLGLGLGVGVVVGVGVGVGVGVWVRLGLRLWVGLGLGLWVGLGCLLRQPLRRHYPRPRRRAGKCACTPGASKERGGESWEGFNRNRR
jgi:hypothetical protein